MSDSSDIKAEANPFTQFGKKLDKIIEQNSEIIVQNEIKVTLLDRLCTLKEDFQTIWFKSSNKKFKVSIIAIMVTGAVLYMDILKLNPDSEIIDSTIKLIDNLSRWIS